MSQRTVDRQVEDYVLAVISDFPEDFAKSFMASKRCFRTEVRSTGYHICGIHLLEEWKAEKEDCPEAVEAATIALGAFWKLLAMKPVEVSTVSATGHFEVE